MEYFDLVDENDNVIGTTDKPTAYAKKQLHRVAAVYVFNGAGGCSPRFTSLVGTYMIIR